MVEPPPQPETRIVAAATANKQRKLMTSRFDALADSPPPPC
jgi:hypothetical protein